MSKPTPIPFHQQLSLDLAKVQTVLSVFAEQDKPLPATQARELANALEETRERMVGAFNNIKDVLQSGGNQ